MLVLSDLGIPTVNFTSAQGSKLGDNGNLMYSRDNTVIYS
jgi:hypothetical protein